MVLCVLKATTFWAVKNLQNCRTTSKSCLPRVSYFHISLEGSLELRSLHSHICNQLVKSDKCCIFYKNLYFGRSLDTILIFLATRYLVTQFFYISLEASVEESRMRALQSYWYQVLDESLVYGLAYDITVFINIDKCSLRDTNKNWTKRPATALFTFYIPRVKPRVKVLNTGYGQYFKQLGKGIKMFPLGKGGHVNICGAAQELILFSQRIMPLAEIFLFHKKMYTFVTLLFIRSVENQWKISANSVQNFVKSVYLENPSKVSIFQ